MGAAEDTWTPALPTRSGALDEFATALSKAQAIIRPAIKDAANPFFKSKYADLASVWDACRDALTANGFSVVQLPCGDARRVGVTTTLLHSSGQWMASTIYAEPVQDGPQAMGSVITYLRRYALAAAVGVAPEDDDGNAASGKAAPVKPANDNARPNKAAPNLARREADPPPASDGTAAPSSSKVGLRALRKYHAMRDELKISEDEGRERVGKVLGREVKSISDVTPEEMDVVLDKMERTVSGNAS